jgi:hypothetical protein
MRPKNDSVAATVPQPIALQPGTRRFGNETWETRRERLDAEWTPLVDEKNRRVHGQAFIEETPAHMLGREIHDGSCRMTIDSRPFGVRLVATRDDKAFGALARTTRHATHTEALRAAQRGLTAQGNRYAKKYGRTA